MIELINVTKQYSNSSVLKNVTLNIDDPGIYCLLGRNGTGKTTLLKSITGYKNISAGKIQVIIVSTHIIEEIAKTIQKLIIFDKGCIRFFDTLQAVETKAFSVSCLKKVVDMAIANLNVIGHDTVGDFVTSYLFDNPPKEMHSLKNRQLSIRDFFIQMVGHKGGTKE